MEYFIKEKGIDEDVQLQRNTFTDIRVGKITDVLYENKPSDLLPLKGKFPIVDWMDQAVFLERCGETHLFSDLPYDLKLKVRRAEKAKWLHDRFYDFLQDKGIGVQQFKAKNPKTKQDLMYEWLFSNKMDIGILEI